VRTYEAEREEKVRYVRNSNEKEPNGKEFNNSDSRKIVPEEPAKIDKIEDRVLPKSPEPKKIELKREESKRDEPKKEENSVASKQLFPKINMKFPPPPPPPSAPQYKSFENKR
jgi:hypothetical protein